jgi:hypothetical protein
MVALLHAYSNNLSQSHDYFVFSDNDASYNSVPGGGAAACILQQTLQNPTLCCFISDKDASYTSVPGGVAAA